MIEHAKKNNNSVCVFPEHGRPSSVAQGGPEAIFLKKTCCPSPLDAIHAKPTGQNGRKKMAMVWQIRVNLREKGEFRHLFCTSAIHPRRQKSVFQRLDFDPVRDSVRPSTGLLKGRSFTKKARPSWPGWRLPCLWSTQCHSFRGHFWGTPLQSIDLSC